MKIARIKQSLLRYKMQSVNNSADYDYQVCNLCSSCAHCSKSFVTRSIKECNPPSVLEFYIISSYMLRYSACLSCYYICISYMVEQRGFTMVYVSHYSNNRGPWKQIFRFILLILLLNCLLNLGCYEIYFIPELFRYKNQCFGIEPLVN